MNNAFYFILKALLLRYLHFCPACFGYAGKRLDKKAKENVKIHDVTSWNTINYNRYIPNIPKSKRNQTMKFGQLIEYNVKSCRK